MKQLVKSRGAIQLENYLVRWNYLKSLIHASQIKLYIV